MKLLCLFLAILAGMTGCVDSHYAVAPSTSVSYTPEMEVLPHGSLFKEDTAVMGNEDFARILAYKLQVPTDAKLAVVRFGQMPYWWGWSEEFTRMNDEIDSQSGRSHLAEFAE